MRGFDNILVPLDFSDGKSQILESALRVLGDGGRITALHVVEWLPAVTEGTFGIYAHRQDVDKHKAEALRRLESYAAKHPGVDIQAAVSEGKPATAILEEVEELAPDLIVMGTHGRSRLDHLLIGSVAERVLRKASCPVLTVRF